MGRDLEDRWAFERGMRVWNIIVRNTRGIQALANRAVKKCGLSVSRRAKRVDGSYSGRGIYDEHV